MVRIKLGISTCLTGEPVRYDGGSRLDRFLRDTLGAYVEYAPVCPEVECGLGTPREPMRLEGDPEAQRLVTTQTRRDLTDRMVDWASRRVIELENDNLCGFIFKSSSPSSGMERVKVFDSNGVPHRIGTGIFASVFMRHFPLIPVEDEEGLHDPELRENFIERIFVLKSWREMIAKEPRISHLVDFHTRHKLLIMAHAPTRTTKLGNLLAKARDMPVDQLYSGYLAMLVEALKLKATVKKNTNVLQHAMGYFKRQISDDGKLELLEAIDRYHDGYLPLIVPLTLIRHYARKYDQPYLKEQYYLNPHPVEMLLRYHV
jgi:uncharacterized protein YbgA (DUF1722 family)/uncharacterized protein YbbK (DUF523 family)